MSFRTSQVHTQHGLGSFFLLVYGGIYNRSSGNITGVINGCRSGSHDSRSRGTERGPPHPI
ncbi:hypothetical protein NJ7G_2139 [Natrinema sp. J7-2]|nr:hypothetical protein NJ7G_2139 [Natrinema sp. J7-2]